MISRLSFLGFLFPRRYVNTAYHWATFNPEAWSREFTWRVDGWGGMKDVIQPVGKTLTKKRGDCEDYAFVILSYLVAMEAEHAEVCYLMETSLPPKGHVIAYDGENVYTSGAIQQKSPKEYKEDSKYDVLLRRRVR